MSLKTLMFLGCAFVGYAPIVAAQTAAPQGDPAAAASADDGGIVDIVVTAQKRSERLQSVPIAVSAFSQETLTAAGIRETQDLRTQVPNLQFSRTATNTANISIRGIGSNLVNASADPGVGVHQNNAPLSNTRLVDADIYDVERVEVLRGPQGTLYGRNATGGVVNFITRKPGADFAGSVAAEYGSYDTVKLLGMLNLPLAEGLGIRVAGSYVKRDGYSFNTYTGHDVDDRKLWSGRVTLGYESGNLKAFLIYEHFQENDSRMRSQVTRCTPDAGPTSVSGVPTNLITQGLLSQGCKNASIYTASALGAPNTFGTVYGTIGLATGVLTRNANLGVTQNSDLRKFASLRDPTYKANSNLYQGNLVWGFSSGLELNINASHSDDRFDSRQDPLSAVPIQNSYNVTALSPGGVRNDPQFGAVTAPAGLQGSIKPTKQTSIEARIQSSFDGPVNFNIGGIYYKMDQVNQFLFATDAFTTRSIALNLAGSTIYIDPLAEPDLTGHNYLISRTEYELRSKALMGEVYWSISDKLRLTAGVRYTDDDKRQIEYPGLLFSNGRGYLNPIESRTSFKEITGKLNVSWKPDVSFTESTIIYASYSKGYKGGGFNGTAAGTGLVPPSYQPEFVNAFEIGTKNTLSGGRVVFNATGFYYNYKDYQIGKLVGINTATENVDATVKGLEFETIVEPVRGLRFNGTLSLLDATINQGASVDASNPTAGDPSLVVVKAGAGTNCVANAAGVAGILAGINAGQIPAGALLGLCSNAFAGAGVTISQGVAQSLKGKSLPNAPKWSFNLGAQYTADLSTDWTATLRGDYYRQAGSFSQLYNTAYDRLDGYDNLNVSLSLKSSGSGLEILAFVRNLTDKDSIATAVQTNQLFGLYNTLFLNDPRTYGVRITKTF